MNYRSFRSSLIAAAAFATLAFAAAPASANCDVGCTPTQPPAAPTGFNFNISTGVAFGGEGFGSFGGANGNVEIMKEGFGVTQSAFTVGGDMCGVDCAAGGFTASGAAGEQVNVKAWATGNNAWVKNGGQAATLLQLNVQKTVTP